VQVTVDQARGHELAGGVEATIDRSVEPRTDVDDAIVLEDHAPVGNQLVSAAAVTDHPAAWISVRIVVALLGEMEARSP